MKKTKIVIMKGKTIIKKRKKKKGQIEEYVTLGTNSDK